MASHRPVRQRLRSSIAPASPAASPSEPEAIIAGRRPDGTIAHGQCLNPYGRGGNPAKRAQRQRAEPLSALERVLSKMVTVGEGVRSKRVTVEEALYQLIFLSALGNKDEKMIREAVRLLAWVSRGKRAPPTKALMQAAQAASEGGQMSEAEAALYDRIMEEAAKKYGVKS